MGVAIEVNHITRAEDSVEVDLRIYEGVYAKDHYRVRIVDVPAPPPGLGQTEQDALIAEFATDKVRTHMRRGALPPRGVQIEAEAIWDRLRIRE